MNLHRHVVLGNLFFNWWNNLLFHSSIIQADYCFSCVIVFCPWVCCMACIVILVYLLVLLLNVLRNFSFVVSGSGLCDIKILYRRWEVANSTAAPLLEMALSYSLELAYRLFATTDQKWSFCNFFLFHFDACFGMLIYFAEYLSEQK